MIKLAILVALLTLLWAVPPTLVGRAVRYLVDKAHKPRSRGPP